MYKNITYSTIITMVDKYLVQDNLDIKHKEILITIKHILEMNLNTSYNISSCLSAFMFSRTTFYKYLNIIISNKPVIKKSNRPKSIKHHYN